MSEPIDMKSANPEPSMATSLSPGNTMSIPSISSSLEETGFQEPVTPGYVSSAPGSPYLLSRNSSFISSKEGMEYYDDPPPDKANFFDMFDSLSLIARVEQWQATLAAQKDRMKRQQEKLRSTGTNAKDKALAQLKRRVPTSEEQLAKYRARMKRSMDGVNKRWKETVTMSAREKISFISAVFNIFISGYLIGAVPEYFYYWFTAQFFYFMPIRAITYYQKGMHYFLVDLCYFVNLLCLMSIWAFPRSKRLFISAYCLSYGNNAVAIVMWRNSLVLHSLDKVTSLFIHVMPPVTLHCLVHLTPPHILADRFPAIYNIKFSAPGAPEHYTLAGMILWATLPYAIWQLAYHFFITIRRADKIAAGRLTSFVWLRKSYANTAIGKFVIRLPESLQEPVFMLIQYTYACLTIIPCPLWFWYRWPSAMFLMFVFGWSIWNGANYYMDIYGKKFQKELEQMKREMARIQNSPGALTPSDAPMTDQHAITGKGPEGIPMMDLNLPPPSVDHTNSAGTTGTHIGADMNGVRKRE